MFFQAGDQLLETGIVGLVVLRKKVGCQAHIEESSEMFTDSLALAARLSRFTWTWASSGAAKDAAAVMSRAKNGIRFIALAFYWFKTLSRAVFNSSEAICSAWIA